MAAVSVTAAPAMGLLIVDSMTVPVDQRYSEGMLGAFSLIARVCLIVGVCLVKGGGKTYHWVVDVRRKPTIEPPTWPTLPPPFTLTAPFPPLSALVRPARPTPSVDSGLGCIRNSRCDKNDIRLLPVL